MQTQPRNSTLFESLRPDFQARNEPNFAWVNACSAHQLLPNVRAFWPMSSRDLVGDYYDISGQGRTLTNPGGALSTTTNWGLAPYSSYLIASTQYLMRINEPDLAIVNGLTLGAWVWFDTLAATQATMGMWSAASQSYLLQYANGVGMRFLITDVGMAIPLVTSTVALATGQWYFIVGRFIPATQIDIFVSDPATALLVQTTTATPGSASLNPGLANYTIGANGTPANYMSGRVSLAWICAHSLSDAVVQALYQQTRAMYGVI